MISSHSHSGQFCSHGHGFLKDCILKAISKKFTLYGLTEHMPRSRNIDLYPEEIIQGQTCQGTYDLYSNYYKEALDLKREFKGEIEVLIGMEIEWIYENTMTELNELMDKFPIEYLVGSVHHVNGIPIDYDRDLFYKAVAAEGNVDKLFEKYYDLQYEMITKVKPKVIGHFDLIRMNFEDVNYSKEVGTSDS
jgi:histidinol-phosphatase (PHP family)